MYYFDICLEDLSIATRNCRVVATIKIGKLMKNLQTLLLQPTYTVGKKYPV